ncbi:MAG: hypothetical protein ABWZ80_09750 [Beijerinckiaceae bacterium]
MAGGNELVRERIVFHIAGYENVPASRAYDRFVRELQRFKRTWSVDAEASKPEFSFDQAAWDIETKGPNWSVTTHYHLARWDDLIGPALAVPMWRWLSCGLFAIGHFFWHGVLFAYLRTNWRYAIFFIYPLALFAGIVLLAVTGGWLATSLSGSLWLGLVVACVAFPLFAHLGKKIFLLHHLFADWIFSVDYLRRGDPELGARLDQLADRFISVAVAETADEIVVIGHSLGAVLAIELFDRVVQKGAELGKLRTRSAVLSIGSSILKIGLHPGARDFRAATFRVASNEAIFWADFQARIDIMNFFRTEPLPAMGLPDIGKPVVRHVSIRRMLTPKEFRRIWRNFFRIHRQFISGNDLRNAYDYYMFVCGPFSAEALATSAEGAVTLLDAAGALPATTTSQQPEASPP